jgi:hypothetical protein
VAFDRRKEGEWGGSGMGGTTWSKGGLGVLAPVGAHDWRGRTAVIQRACEAGDKGGVRSGRAAAGLLPWAGPRPQC